MRDCPLSSRTGCTPTGCSTCSSIVIYFPVARRKRGHQRIWPCVDAEFSSACLAGAISACSGTPPSNQRSTHRVRDSRAVRGSPVDCRRYEQSGRNLGVRGRNRHDRCSRSKGRDRRAARWRRVDLTGKTVIPALVSAHMHVGLLSGCDFGPEHLHGATTSSSTCSATPTTAWPRCSAPAPMWAASFDIERERPPQAARLLTAGRGMAAPDGGPGIPSIANTSFPITDAPTRRGARPRAGRARGARGEDLGGRSQRAGEEAHARHLPSHHRGSAHATA